MDCELHWIGKFTAISSILMSKRVYLILLISTIILFLYSLLQIAGVMVSLKYETGFDDECISNISGDNLCNILTIVQIIAGALGCSALGLIAFRKRIIKVKQ